MNELDPITLLDLAIAASLLVVNLVLSAALKLGMGRRLVVASVRMAVQLLLPGAVLDWVFRSADGLAVLGIAPFLAVSPAFSVSDVVDFAHLPVVEIAEFHSATQPG